MVRTQIQLTERQASTLKALALARNVSMAELIRLSVDRFVALEASTSREARIQRALSAIGRYSSGGPDIGADHDRYLAEAFKA